MAPPFPSRSNADNGLTLTVLGCGTMGIAILSGILSSLSDAKASRFLTPSTSSSSSQLTPSAYSHSGTATPAEEPPVRLPTRFIATVKRPHSAKKVTDALTRFHADVTVLVDENVKAARAADILLLACEPQAYREILGEPGMKEALAGKMLMTILAGVKAAQLETFVYGDVAADPDAQQRCRFVSVLPNTAAAVRESMTYVANSTPPLSLEQTALVEWIFSKIGRVVHLPAPLLGAATAMCGSGIAFMAVVVEAMADGAVAMGVPRAEALFMAAQVMRGASSMVLDGEHPAVVKDKVCTPGGCTIVGVLGMEEGRVRGTISRALRDATEVASRLGKPKVDS